MRSMSLQLRFTRIGLRSALHHVARLERGVQQCLLELLGAPLEARDRPADVIVADAVRQAVPVGNDLMKKTQVGY